jgi:methyl-accepting chemotaxis protein
MDQMLNNPLETAPLPHGAPFRETARDALGDAPAEHWRRLRRWLHSHSIRVRLYSVFALLFLLVIGLGVFGFARLSDVNRASEVIRNHWLRDTGILGDISNYMSDYRTAEATHLLSFTPLELAASAKELAKLHDTVAASQRAYMEISQDPSETALYTRFAAQWAIYQGVAAQVIALANNGQTAEAVSLYNTDSRRAFDISAHGSDGGQGARR